MASSLRSEAQSADKPIRMRYVTLLAAMASIIVVQFFLGPIGKAGQFILQALFVAAIIAGVVAITQRRTYLIVAAALFVPAVLLSLAIEEYGTPRMNLIRDVSVLLLFVATAVTILYDILSKTRVESDTVLGAICAYLLFGLIWAMFYTVLLHFDAAAIRFPLADAPAQPEEAFSLLVYFSFVTLTTLGYGDIQPVSSTAREAAWLEAVTGQLYIAVLIARLVGQRIAAGRAPSS